MTNLDPMYFYLKLHIQLPDNARVQMDGHVKSLGASHVIMPWYVSLSIAPPSPSEIWSWIGPCGLPKNKVLYVLRASRKTRPSLVLNKELLLGTTVSRAKMTTYGAATYLQLTFASGPAAPRGTNRGTRDPFLRSRVLSSARAPFGGFTVHNLRNQSDHPRDASFTHSHV